MTRVLPLPAPARISRGPSVVVTASRCGGLSFSKKSIINLITIDERIRQCDFRNLGAQAHGLHEVQKPVIFSAINLFVNWKLFHRQAANQSDHLLQAEHE